MKYGIIDLGSNTIRLVIFKIENDLLSKTLNVKRTTQAISYVENGILTPSGIKAVTFAVRELILIARAFDVDELCVFATASLRNIQNSKEAKEQIEKNLNIKIDLLSGNEEAIFGFNGVKRGVVLPKIGISVDIGGGSTEITYFANGVPINDISLPFGSLSMYLKHIKNIVPTAKEHEKMREDIQNALAEVDFLQNLTVDNLIGIGGTSRSILKIYEAQNHLEESMFELIIPTTEITRTSMMVEGKKSAGVKLLLTAVPDRITTALPGAIIMDEICRNVKAKNFILSRYGVREGYLYSRILKQD
jgi:exopolyphosphatase/guanosine-5'-triphosphate,3'-diphosphate pyrophosphatase